MTEPFKKPRFKYDWDHHVYDYVIGSPYRTVHFIEVPLVLYTKSSVTRHFKPSQEYLDHLLEIGEYGFHPISLVGAEAV